MSHHQDFKTIDAALLLVDRMERGETLTNNEVATLRSLVIETRKTLVDLHDTVSMQNLYRNYVYVHMFCKSIMGGLYVWYSDRKTKTASDDDGCRIHQYPERFV